MPEPSTKELLLFKGAEIMHSKGFQNTGILEVLEAAGVPKGSFYYYFKNKEDFGLQVIDIYAGVMFKTLQESMALTDLSLVERLRAFFRSMTDRAMDGFSGCPIGNLSQEMGEISESFRNKLDGIFRKLEQDIAGLIKEAQTAGEIKTGENPERLAVFLVSSWEGALLRMKLTRTTEPYEIFEQNAFNEILIRK